MTNTTGHRWVALFRRELDEYRVSLVWTPLGMVLALATVMLISVLVANRISAVGEAIFEVVVQEDPVSGMNIKIEIDEEPPADTSASYRIEDEVAELPEAQWNFAREWQFDARGDREGEDPVSVPASSGSFNPLLGLINALMMGVLFLVTVNYLLGSLFDDRKDRSILFWKSMPVSEWRVVGSKLVVALALAPAIFIAASLLAQCLFTLLAMVLVWRMDMDPFQQVIANLDVGGLLYQQVGGWLVAALWIAPLYAWLLLASAAARRSPFMMAVVPVIALLLLEKVLLGTSFLGTAIGNHLPWAISVDYASGPPTGQGAGHGLLNLAAGLACAAALLAGAVWLRRNRWEI